MRPNPLGAILVGVFAACALITAWVSLRYYFSMKEWHRLQAQAFTINSTRSAIQGLASEAVEYSRRNPAIDSVLQRFDIKSPSTNALATNQPAPPLPAAKP